MDRDVADHEVSFQNQREHVFTDVPRFHDLSGGCSTEVSRFQRGINQLVVGPLKIQHLSRRVFLHLERADDKDTCHALTPFWVRVGPPWRPRIGSDS